MIQPAQSTNVTTTRLVTMDILVTRETLVAQALSPLSPLSPLSAYTVSRAYKGFRPTCDTGDTGDTGDTAFDHPSAQNRIVTGSNEALGYDLTVEPSLDAGPSGVDGEEFVALSRDCRRTNPMLNQPPLTVSSCAELSSLFKLAIVRLPEFIWKVSREVPLSRSGTLSTVTRITKGTWASAREAGGGYFFLVAYPLGPRGPVPSLNAPNFCF